MSYLLGRVHVNVISYPFFFLVTLLVIDRIDMCKTMNSFTLWPFKQNAGTGRNVLKEYTSIFQHNLCPCICTI